MARSSLSPLFTWRSALADSDLEPPTRHVGLAISLYMNERGGSAFPERLDLPMTRAIRSARFERT